jgi:hypothetical protein
MMERHFLPHGVQEFNLAGNSRADLDHSGRRTRRLGIKGTSHGRHNLKAVADDDSLPVMVPRNDKTAVPISRVSEADPANGAASMRSSFLTPRWREQDSNHWSRGRHLASSRFRVLVRADSSSAGMKRHISCFRNRGRVARYRRFESDFFQRRV